jgi:hypothetical protein
MVLAPLEASLENFSSTNAKLYHISYVNIFRFHSCAFQVQSYTQMIYISCVYPVLCPHLHGGIEENNEKPQPREPMTQPRGKTGTFQKRV